RLGTAVESRDFFTILAYSGPFLYVKHGGRPTRTGKIINRQGAMATSTIVVARADLTIPGALEPCPGESDPAQIENDFFKTLDQHKADAVVLDLTGSHEEGVAAIRRIRQRSAVPIIVICRLRKKLGILAGPAGQRLIKPELGRGYVFAAEAVPAWPAASPARGA